VWQGFPGSWLRESGFLRLWSMKLATAACSTWIALIGKFLHSASDENRVDF